MAVSMDVVERLIDWEIEINRKFPHQPYIRVRNCVDDEGPPSDFVLVSNYVSKCVKVDEEPVVGCECDDCSRSMTCCPFLADPNGNIPNYKNGMVNLSPGNAIYECNNRCRCGMDCVNRVVQKGRKVKLEIFRTNDGRGWGLKTLESIKQGEFVLEYIGEVITKAEADIREESYDFESCTYLFDLNFDNSGSPYVVDATRFGNVARFVNHSCSPNMDVYAVYINQVDGRLPRLAFFARKFIKKDEELTFDYKMNTKKKGRPRANSKMESEEPVKKILCRCGSRNCRKYMN